MLIGGIAFSFVHQPWNFTGQLSITSILAVLFVIIFGTLIAFYSYLESLKYIKPTEASILSSVEPLSAAFFICILASCSIGNSSVVRNTLYYNHNNNFIFMQKIKN